MEGHIIWKNKNDRIMMDSAFREVHDVIHNICKHGVMEGDELKISILPNNHATQELGSEDKGLEGQASGSERAERPLS